MWVELSFFVKVPHHLLNGEALLFIEVDVGAKVELGLVIANVVVALATNGSQAKGNVIDTVSGAESVSSLRVSVFPEENAALHA